MPRGSTDTPDEANESDCREPAGALTDPFFRAKSARFCKPPGVAELADALDLDQRERDLGKQKELENPRRFAVYWRLPRLQRTHSTEGFE